MLSVIVPVYNEENILDCAVRLSNTLKSASIKYEIIFVDDGSSNNVWQEIVRLSESKEGIRGIQLSRNFGKENAICAGIDSSVGDCAVCIDADMQHPPEIIPKMYKLWQQGYEVVEGVKLSRRDKNKCYGICANMFYRIFKSVSHMDFHNSSDFRLLDKKAVTALRSMGEYHVFFRGMSNWIGFKHTRVYFNVNERKTGSGKWTKTRLAELALSALTSYSALPLYLISAAGAVFFILFCIVSAHCIFREIFRHKTELFEIIMLIQLFTSAAFMIGIGILGIYIHNIHDEVLKRPRYIVSRITECKPPP